MDLESQGFRREVSVCQGDGDIGVVAAGYADADEGGALTFGGATVWAPGYGSAVGAEVGGVGGTTLEINGAWVGTYNGVPAVTRGG